MQVRGEMPRSALRGGRGRPAADAADAFYATYAVEGPRAGARAGPRARRAGAGPGAGMTDNLKFYFMWPVGS